MSGLEDVGIPGPDNLREALTNCTDPLTAIEEFQVQNGILLPSLRPALPFLDLHGVRRLEFHNSVMEELRDKLMTRVKELAASQDKNKIKTLNDLLTKSFPVIKVKSLQPVVMCIMQHLPKIKQDYLTTVIDDQELYKAAAVEVKQQIWQDNQALFGDEVSPLLAKYIEDKENALLDHKNLSHNFFSPTPKVRRQDNVVQQMVKMVGKNIKLYDMVLQFLRTLFLRTRNVHYCTLRAEILMALHDQDIADICNVDPCHKFAWCLDACIREKFVDSKRARELQGFLDGIRRGQEQVLGDICMILCDPFSIHTIALSIMKTLNSLVASEGLPRQNEELHLLMRMLALGLGAWHMIDSQHFKEPKLESSLITKLLPCIVSLMVDDMYSQMGGKGGDDPQEIDAAGLCRDLCRDNRVATTCVAYYAIQVSRQKDISAVIRILPELAAGGDPDTLYHDKLLHTLVSNLSQLLLQPSLQPPQDIDLCSAVFTEFLLPQISRENVLRQLMRLLWHTHHKLPGTLLEQLRKHVQPHAMQHSEEVKKVYDALIEKIDTYEPEPMIEPEKLDSPLMSVPAPTPAHPSQRQ